MTAATGFATLALREFSVRYTDSHMSLDHVSVFCLLSGLGIGLTRRRMHRKTTALHAAMPEGWGSWFWQGFADMAVETHRIVAAVMMGAGVLVGLWLVSLSVQLR